VKSIQITALVLWVTIFIVAAFVLGQFLVSKDIFDVTYFITGQQKEKESTENKVEDELANDVMINKIGQETVRVGLNIAKEYFSNYYKGYLNYIMANNEKYKANEKTAITNTLASDYVFYAISKGTDLDKYKSNVMENEIIISESEINSFVDMMFGKEIDEAYKKDGKYGYDKLSKKYSMEKSNPSGEYSQELQKIENVTSNQIELTFSCKMINGKSDTVKKEETIKLICIYKGGRYVVTEVQI